MIPDSIPPSLSRGERQLPCRTAQRLAQRHQQAAAGLSNPQLAPAWRAPSIQQKKHIPNVAAASERVSCSGARRAAGTLPRWLAASKSTCVSPLLLKGKLFRTRRNPSMPASMRAPCSGQEGVVEGRCCEGRPAAVWQFLGDNIPSKCHCHTNRYPLHGWLGHHATLFNAVFASQPREKLPRGSNPVAKPFWPPSTSSCWYCKEPQAVAEGPDSRVLGPS